MNNFKHAIMSGAAFVTVFASGATFAQTTGGPVTSAGSQVEPNSATAKRAPADDKASQLEEVVVTARKRAQSEVLQDTPITAAAFTSDQLSNTASVNLSDVGRLTPNVSFQPSNQQGQQNFEVRGIGVSGSTAADEPAVGVFQDGVYIANKSGSVTELFDLESVQVLLGPQGTLFGRNVTGGAVVVESRQPTFTESEHVGFGYGNGNTVEAQTVLNGPLPGAGGIAAGRLAVLYRDTDGLYKDGNTGGAYGADRTWLIRPSLLLRPTDDLDILIRGEWYSIHGDADATRGIVPSTVAGAPVSEEQKAGYVMPRDYYTITTNPSYTNQDIYSATVEFDYKLAGGVLTSITGYRSLKVDLLQDFDGTPLAIFSTGAHTRQHQVSTELRYARKVGEFMSFTAGAYYFDQAFNEYDRRTLDFGATNLATYAKLKDDNSFAGFAEADFNLVEDLTLTLGGRYTTETKVAQLAPYGQCSFDWSNCTFGAEKSATYTNFSPKGVLSYHIEENNLVYGSVSQGFRAGGYSLSVPGQLASPYLPEKVTQYEVGTKNEFLSHRLRVNLSAYYSDYTNIQRVVVAADPTIGIVTSTFNAAKAKIYGGEVTVNAQVTDWLRLDGVYGLTHARYDQFLGVADPGMLRFARVPADTGSFSATVTHHFADGGQIEALGAISYTSKYFFDDLNTQYQNAYHLIDSTLTYRPASRKYSISLYGRNLANTEYANWGSFLGVRGQNQFLGTPRSFGFRVGYDF
jgi:iron complex outermembrane recepter protein